MIGLGTAALGRPHYINIRVENCDNSNLDQFKKQSFAVLEEAYQAGIRYFDTAPGYGLAEDLLLNWLKTKNDKSVEISTKWGYTYTANFNKNAKIHEVKEHSLSKLKEQWEFSKQLMPYLKIYQIHSATLETGILENKAVLEHLDFLKRTHNIKIGITTTGSNQVEVVKKALKITSNNTLLFDVFQVTYNFLDQSLLTVIDELALLNKTIIIKEGLANGRVFRNSQFPHYNNAYTALENIANKYQVGIDAVALQFCLQTVPNSSVLSGASSCKQLKENLKATTFSLSKKDILLLKSFKVTPDFYWTERKQLKWN